MRWMTGRSSSDTTRHRRDCGRDFNGFRKIDVSDKAIINAVDSDVNHDSSRPDHITRDEVGAADSCDQDVRLSCDFRKIAGAAVADGDGGIGAGFLLEEDIGNWFADDVAPANYHDLCAVNLQYLGIHADTAHTGRPAVNIRMGA